MYMSTHKQQYNKRHGFQKDEAHSKQELSKISKVPYSILDEVVKKGEAAFHNNPSSVRPNVKSATQWGYARLYAFLNKMEKGVKLNHDTELAKKIKWYKK